MRHVQLAGLGVPFCRMAAQAPYSAYDPLVGLLSEVPSGILSSVTHPISSGTLAL
ncbi:TPA: hypothetical protein N3A31_003101 [Salmonella enterica subsp. houtenae serovar 43:z4,z32:-]|nr:hypothetical protein [Salmonella enterica subsp. enterica serovar Tallahassee]EIG0992825.1 hypothetical protein [Salmonella enterica]EJP2999442.1 hypothetical protein [Salmonella enterica]ELU4387382.1 hypothetical protein [Salmonella enterica]HCM1865154.1 hypothetical protein [Salmonella enterica subsp. houtenae serovar 43:z4,z32:-]